MIHYSVFLLFIVSANARRLDLLQILEDNIDDTVEPCDDFYRHACSKHGPVDTTWDYLMGEAYALDLKDILQNRIPPAEMRSILRVSRISKSGLAKSPLISLSNKYLQLCQQNSTDALLLLQKLELFHGQKPNAPCEYYRCFSNLAFDSNCTQASETLLAGVAWTYHQLEEVVNKKKEWFQTILENGLATVWSLQHQDEFEQISEMFRFFKSELMPSLEKTPWIQNSNSLEAYSTILGRLYYSLPEEEIGQTLDAVFAYQIAYQECVNNFEILGEYATEYCVAPSLQTLGGSFDMNVINAYNLHPRVVVYNTIVNLMSDNSSISLKYGSVGSALAHEIGHSLILSGLSDGFYPYYSSEINPCIQNQFNKTCSIYKEAWCSVKDYQIDENGADIFGFPFAYERLKQKMGKKIHEKIPGSKRGLTHAQAFFHILYNIGCQRSATNDMGDTHSANNVRVNAGVVQIPDFRKVFNCSKNSRMMRSKTKKCHILGPKAPQE